MGWEFSGVRTAPARGTTLPGSPVDGQEFILTDNLSAPTYDWRFVYVAAKASNKWVFIGGSPLHAEVATDESTSSTTYVALTTAGPSVAVPVAGDYFVEHGFRGGPTAGSGQILATMSYDIGGTGAVDADFIQSGDNSPNVRNSVFRRKKKTGLTAVTLTAKYKTSGGTTPTVAFAERWMSLTPVAIGG